VSAKRFLLAQVLAESRERRFEQLLDGEVGAQTAVALKQCGQRICGNSD